MLRKYSIRPRNHGSFPPERFTCFLKIVVGKVAAVVVALKPMVKMDLIEVGRNEFLSQFVVFTAQEGNLQPGESGNQRLCDAIRTAARTGVRRFNCAQGGCDHQEPRPPP